VITHPVYSVSLFPPPKLMSLVTVQEADADYFCTDGSRLIKLHVRKIQRLLENQLYVACFNAHTYAVATVDSRFGIFSPFLPKISSVPGIPDSVLNAAYYRENMNPNLLANYLGVRSAHEILFTYFYIHHPNLLPTYYDKMLLLTLTCPQSGTYARLQITSNTRSHKRHITLRRELLTMENMSKLLATSTKQLAFFKVHS